MDENDALVRFSLKGNAVIDEHHLRNRGEVGEEIACIRIRVHDRIGCSPAFRRKKADRFWFAPWEANTQTRCGGTQVRHDNFPPAVAGDESGTDGRLKKRTGFGSHPEGAKTKARCGRSVSSAS